jgi:hypothetical protein
LYFTGKSDPMKKEKPSQEQKTSKMQGSRLSGNNTFLEKVKESGYRCQQETKDGYTVIHLMPLEYLIRNNWRY